MFLLESVNSDHELLYNHYNFKNFAFGKGEDNELYHAISSYNGSGSHSINNHLWRSHTFTHKPIPGFDVPSVKRHNDILNTKIKTIDEGMNRHLVPKNLTVYSGTPNDPREHESPNGIVHHPAYLSTSIHPRIAMRFAKDHKSYEGYDEVGKTHVLRINVPKGHSGLYVPGILGQYDNKYMAGEEKELILPRGLNLRRTKTTIHHVPDISRQGKEKYYLSAYGALLNKNAPANKRRINNIMHVHHMEIV